MKKGFIKNCPTNPQRLKNQNILSFTDIEQYVEIQNSTRYVCSAELLYKQEARRG